MGWVGFARGRFPKVGVSPVLGGGLQGGGHALAPRGRGGADSPSRKLAISRSFEWLMSPVKTGGRRSSDGRLRAWFLGAFGAQNTLFVTKLQTCPTSLRIGQSVIEAPHFSSQVRQNHSTTPLHSVRYSEFVTFVTQAQKTVLVKRKSERLWFYNCASGSETGRVGLFLWHRPTLFAGSWHCSYECGA